ncbi:DUF58 domain-containing protein [Halalkalibacter urbisdiaboli]|uniref:DUF58 domain-containing protein n=1 Tax=Halalkalibacter urbisdiaboli TaxID=1960589 RepID=UPI000B451FD5|nr:DUF58 domain-containing protein [Halalkalibacter urbisdiaboli]
MNIAWVIFVTFLIVGIQGYIYNKWGLTRIFYTRSFNEKAVHEGEQVEMIDEIVNKKLLPVPWLRLESKIHTHLKFRKEAVTDNEIDGDDFHRTLFSLMPYQKIKRRQKLTCMKRGYYRYEEVSLSTGDIFGFGSTFRSVPSSAEITVYPKITSLNEIPLPAHSWLGDIVVRRWIIDDPFLISGVRDYSYGDPLNAVNWKATARTNRLQVSQKDFTADHHLMLYVNFNQTEDIWLPIVNKEQVELAISYAASIAQYAINKGVPTGFGCNSYLNEMKKESIRIPPENSRQQLMYVLETMAKLKMGTSMSFPFFLQEDIDRGLVGADILIITSIVTEKMNDHIRSLEAQGNAIEILNLEELTSHAKAN